MRSLASPQSPRPPSDDLQGSRIYVSFCPKDPMVAASSSNTMCNWIESYDPSENSWTRVSRIPGLRDDLVLKGFAIVSVAESVFVIGGRLCRKEMVHVSDELAGLFDTEVEVLSTVLRYDIGLDRWSRCAALSMPRSDFACAVCDGKVYVAGGQSTLASARGVSTAEVYDPVADEWQPLPNMNTTRYKCVGVTWQGKIHVVGGFAERLDSDKASPFITERSSAEVFDPNTGCWELMAKMWQLDVPPRQIVDVEGKLFSSGDCLKAWKGHIEAYDENLNMWNEVESSCNSSLSDMLGAHQRPQIKQLYLTMAPIGTQLYFLAGYRIAEPSSSIRTFSITCVFDTEAKGHQGAWRKLEAAEEEVEKELCCHCCVVRQTL
ncbi:hypothetical protein MLD38_021129 [Melastoma candidum]|uniref:Uncharacterized protein n=1 Tax=Melastoma candidum TaxID=119954 RepID=A0ACB9QF57_9MYRT|nr:hypothetical protein MLD38_021129 [Melastoma candidum]